jgi:hypothetical protein
MGWHSSTLLLADPAATAFGTVAECNPCGCSPTSAEAASFPAEGRGQHQVGLTTEIAFQIRFTLPLDQHQAHTA